MTEIGWHDDPGILDEAVSFTPPADPGAVLAAAFADLTNRVTGFGARFRCAICNQPGPLKHEGDRYVCPACTAITETTKDAEERAEPAGPCVDTQCEAKPCPCDQFCPDGERCDGLTTREAVARLAAETAQSEPAQARPTVMLDKLFPPRGRFVDDEPHPDPNANDPAFVDRSAEPFLQVLQEPGGERP